MIICPRNWNDFQHYKDRSPQWIKLHKSILDNYEYHCLPTASKALAPLLWLLASEYGDGKIDARIDKIAFRLRMPVVDFYSALQPLISQGFFDCLHDDSELLAGCYQDACLEKRREETEKREISAALSPMEVLAPAGPVAADERRVVEDEKPEKPLRVSDVQAMVAKYLGKNVSSPGEVVVIQEMIRDYPEVRIREAFEAAGAAGARKISWIRSRLADPRAGTSRASPVHGLSAAEVEAENREVARRFCGVGGEA